MAPAKTILAQTSATLSGAMFALTMVEDTTFSAITGLTLGGAITLSSVTFPAGLTIYGNFTLITINSGTVLAYFAS